MGLRSRFRNASTTHPEIQNPHPIFSIHEIIQKILLEVPAIDLLTDCRGVCRTWKVLIEVSSSDLRYYSLSGLKRTHSGTVTAAASNQQILSPLAVEVLAKFWKRLAAQTVGGIRDAENRPNVEKSRKNRHLFRRFYRTVHCGARTYDSSRESGVLWTTGAIISICILPFATAGYHFYDKILRHIGPTSQEHRAIKNIGIRLIKEFQPIWQKIHIFNPESTEGAVLLVRAATNWRSRPESWRYEFSMDESFKGLPSAALMLMTPLIDTVYSRRPAPLPTPEAEYDGTRSSVIIDLKHVSDGDYALRYVDDSPREVITLKGNLPYDVYREHKKPPDFAFSRLNNQILRL